MENFKNLSIELATARNNEEALEFADLKTSQIANIRLSAFTLLKGEILQNIYETILSVDDSVPMKEMVWDYEDIDFDGDDCYRITGVVTCAGKEHDYWRIWFEVIVDDEYGISSVFTRPAERFHINKFGNMVLLDIEAAEDADEEVDDEDDEDTTSRTSPDNPLGMLNKEEREILRKYLPSYAKVEIINKINKASGYNVDGTRLDEIKWKYLHLDKPNKEEPDCYVLYGCLTYPQLPVGGNYADFIVRFIPGKEAKVKVRLCGQDHYVD